MIGLHRTRHMRALFSIHLEKIVFFGKRKNVFASKLAGDGDGDGCLLRRAPAHHRQDLCSAVSAHYFSLPILFANKTGSNSRLQFTLATTSAFP